MRPPAKWPGGRLKVEPALGYLRGCLARRRWARSAILARMAAGSPGVRGEAGPVISQGRWVKQLVR